MTDRDNIRPATTAAYKSFTDGNTDKNVQKCHAWLMAQDLKRSQIISISTNETDIEEGDNVITVFYRRDAIFANEAPLDDLQVRHEKPNASWAAQLQQANEIGATHELVTVSRTAKNIGNARSQLTWYTGSTQQTWTTVLTGQGGDLEGLANKVCQWLNCHIPPHQLCSVSLYEEAHPNNSGVVEAIVTHKAGPDPQMLVAAIRERSAGGMYTAKMMRFDGTEQVAQNAVDWINRTGGQEGHVVSTANDSKEQDIFCVVYSWSQLIESQIEQDMRPTGCGGCSIF